MYKVQIIQTIFRQPTQNMVTVIGWRFLCLFFIITDLLGFKLFLFQSLTRKIAKNICDWNTMWKHFIYIDNNDMTTNRSGTIKFSKYTQCLFTAVDTQMISYLCSFQTTFLNSNDFAFLKSISMCDLVSITQTHRFTLVSIHEFTNRWLKFWWDFNFQIIK